VYFVLHNDAIVEVICSGNGIKPKHDYSDSFVHILIIYLMFFRFYLSDVTVARQAENV